jgi:hypothetical protein
MAQRKQGRGEQASKANATDKSLTGISVAYNQNIQASTIKLTRKARAAARRNLDPFGMSSSRRPIRPSDPAQNNPNDIGAVIIPQNNGPM